MIASPLPPWRCREPWETPEAQLKLTSLWADPAYREAVQTSFERLANPTDRTLLLTHVPATSVWVSYVVDTPTHQVVIVWIDDGQGVAGPPKKW